MSSFLFILFNPFIDDSELFAAESKISCHSAYTDHGSLLQKDLFALGAESMNVTIAHGHKVRQCIVPLTARAIHSHHLPARRLSLGNVIEDRISEAQSFCHFIIHYYPSTFAQETTCAIFLLQRLRSTIPDT